MDIFFCDLDNTLIHSHKKFSAGDVCVEIYEGREQSFMTAAAIELLKNLSEKILFVPVTTRSAEQYNRIKLPVIPKFALAANGAILLENGVEVDDWKKLSLEIVRPHKIELENLREKFAEKIEFTHCRIVDEIFLFLRCSDSFETEKIVVELRKITDLPVLHTGKKIYIFPPKMSKGENILRLTKKLPPAKIFSAGDSLIDLPMLNLADFAYIPKDFPREKLSCKNFLVCENAPKFAEKFLSLSK